MDLFIYLFIYIPSFFIRTFLHLNLLIISTSKVQESND